MKEKLLELTADPYVRVSEIPWNLYFILILGFPMALLGLILNAVPFYLSKYISNKKVRQVEFYTPVRMGLNLILYLVWLTLNLIILSSIFGWLSLVGIWIFPLAGFVTILWKEGFDQVRKNKGIKKSNFEEIEAVLYK